MDERGALIVNEYLQVKGHEDIFALGDCTNIKERKMVAMAVGQAELFLNNLVQLSKGAAMKPYKPGKSSSLMYSCKHPLQWNASERKSLNSKE